MTRSSKRVNHEILFVDPRLFKSISGLLHLDPDGIWWAL